MSSDTLKLDGLWFRNFLSFGDKTQYVDLGGERLTIILGENMDTGGEDSRNGVGKSAIEDALSYCWFGKSLRGVPGPKLVNKTMGRLMLTCSEWRRSGMHYRVERGLMPDRLNFYAKPEGNTDPWDAKDAQKKPLYDRTERRKDDTNAVIVKALGLNFDLSELLLFNSSESTPFLRMKDEDKRSIVENLIGITILSEKADVLSKKRLAEKKRLTELESTLNADVAANKRVQAQIDEIDAKVERWEGNRQVQLERQRGAIETYRELAARADEPEPQDDTAETIELLETVEELRRQLKQVEGEASIYATLVRSQAQKRAHRVQMAQQFERQAAQQRAMLEQQKSQRIRDADRTLVEAEHAITDLTVDIRAAEAGTCPHCEQGWVQHPEHLEGLRQSLEHALKNRDAARSKLSIETAASLPEVKLADLPPEEPDEALPEDPAPRVEELRTTLAEIETLVPRTTVAVLRAAFQKKRDEWTRAIAEATAARDYNLPREEAHLLELEAEPNPHTESAAKLRQALVPVNYKAVDDQKALIDHYNLLINLLTSSDSFLRKAIIDKHLPVLNSKIAKYLRRLELPHRVRFNPDLTVDIGLYQEEYDYGNLSKGERLRLTLALNFAFQDLWEVMYFKIGSLMVDELLDNGICARGAENGLGILQDMAREKLKRVLLVTHREDIANRVNDIIRIRKENGFSRIVEKQFS